MKKAVQQFMLGTVMNNEQQARATLDAIKEAGLTDVKVIVGGCPVTEDAANAMGADEWAYSPQKTVKVCQSWAQA